MKMRILTFLTGFICLNLFSLSTLAQTDADLKLESAVRMYNEIKGEISDLKTGASKKESERKRIENRITDALNILDGISIPETEPLYQTIRYFRTNLEYQRGYMYGVYGNIDKMYQLLKPIRPYFDQAGSGLFPLRYLYNGKNYVIKYDDFVFTRGQYYSAVSEGSIKRKEYEETIDFCRTGLSVSTDNFNNVLMSDYLLRSKSQLGQYDQEMIDKAFIFFGAYQDVDKADRAVLDSFNFSYNRGWKYLTEAHEKNSSLSGKGPNFARAAAFMVRFGDKDLAGEAYQKAMDAGYSDKNFLYEVAGAGDYASQNLKTRACNVLATFSLDCSEMSKLSGLYSSNGLYDKSAEFRKKSEKCYAAIDRKARRSGGSGLHMYLGTYPLRFIGHKNYRDYGAVLGLSGGKFQLLGSYMKVKKNMYSWADMFFAEVDDNSDDKYYWSGDQIDLSFRFSPDRFARGESVAYIGPQFGYSTRKLSPMHSDVTDPATGLTATNLEFTPLDTQYQLALTLGQFAGGKGGGIDMNFSIGASYSKFSLENPQYNLKDYSFSHGYLDNREEWHWGLIMRVGFTVGLFL